MKSSLNRIDQIFPETNQSTNDRYNRGGLGIGRKVWITTYAQSHNLHSFLRSAMREEFHEN